MTLKCELTTHWCHFNFVKAEYHKQGISKAMMDLAVVKVCLYSGQSPR